MNTILTKKKLKSRYLNICTLVISSFKLGTYFLLTVIADLLEVIKFT